MSKNPSKYFVIKNESDGIIFIVNIHPNYNTHEAIKLAHRYKSGCFSQSLPHGINILCLHPNGKHKYKYKSYQDHTFVICSVKNTDEKIITPQPGILYTFRSL